MRIHLRFALVLTALLSFVLRADIITLSDGRVVEGDIVSENAAEIVVKASGVKTTIKREEIQSIEKKKSPGAVMREKSDALSKGSDKENKDAWLALAVEASKVGARDESQKAYLRVLQLDADNSEARKALGYVMNNGAWALKSDLKAAANADPNAKPAGAAEPKAFNKAAAAGVNGFGSLDEKPVNCPRCNGTGVWIMLTCLNCNKSGKPGYKNLGDHYEMDQRCGGTGKVVGMYCELCNRTGKVMLSHVTPANGGQKPAPAGWAWCSVCKGTGQESWLPCNQCKRSQWPGYLNMGDQVIVCNSCGGLGKKPALECATCKGKGIVPAAPPGDPNKSFGIGVGPAADKK
ncbi:MAG TPA: hypothetical protein VKX17_24695 [Planctomycetota bacterium]|nr:hypothetical protein [Planctomycetota bacterium]